MRSPGHPQRVKLLPNHRAHDAQHLIQRWRVLARAAGCRVRTLCKAGDFPVIVLESAAAQAREPAVYLSTGVHGDEAGSAWGLLTWAEKNLRRLQLGSFLIAPCVNPVGLTLNTRLDHRGFDINRRFHDSSDEICGPWQQWITGRAMRFGLCLHEDYDAQGIYLYELNHSPQTVGHDVISRCERIMAPDPRRSIDGQRANKGVIRRRTLPTHLPGMPEAIELHVRGCPITLTFESPSEFDFDTRVRVQVKFVESALSLLA
ncbi:M14 family metallocarboxypeptidase [Prosthecobacter sp.]|uniref:M14 family metallocarboxypeptidase n=1 Tax=Prosthecobacter sp. TaxID=1965333 RepID=UPI0037832E6E